MLAMSPRTPRGVRPPSVIVDDHREHARSYSTAGCNRSAFAMMLPLFCG